MLKSLAIDNYLDGFNYEQFSCIDIPIACATGYYHYDNYFYFLFYRSVFNNWSDSFINEFKFDYDLWTGQTNQILNKLGLALKVIKIKDDTHLLSQIKMSIDNKQPVIMPVTYGSLFYNISEYKNEADKASAIIVSEYDEEKSVVVIRDNRHLLNVTQAYERGEPLSRLQLTEELLYDIWVKSNAQFKRMHHHFGNQLLIIDKIPQPEALGYQDIIHDFMNHFLYRSNNFNKVIDCFNQNVATYHCDSFIMWLQRDFKNSLTAFYECFKKAFTEFENNGFLSSSFNNLFNELIDLRNNIISTLHINTYRKRKMSRETVTNLKAKVSSKDRELFSFVEKVYLQKQYKAKQLGLCESTKTQCI